MKKDIIKKSIENKEEKIDWLYQQIEELQIEIGELKGLLKEIDYLNGEGE